MNDENKGFLLTLSNERNHLTAEKRFLNPKKLYIPEIAAEEIALLVSELDGKEKINDAALMVTMTNSNNGVSVDKDVDSAAALADPENAAQIVKDLINIIRGYDMDEETNICGW
ncbi:DUF1869 domain-containing protein [Morganella morganii]|uniref:DUF1869 domain-containing protein n=1 Tax=Morganella morganii TaxID=582 RepID=A0A9Q4GQL7_MORMO|nr:DUF1869 domain-containing protein [Morganella morganii]EBR0232288.1 DUF1869 domain-containing protein [Salmonella enterica subsp. enterica serovar Hadar]BEP21998.1 DUF1869 domain-containing protein [Morganella morganii subsp. sibonii]EGT3624584.1 DUF1869 domain-containing protein [Morganella morganii]EGT3632552.1 DUF1869 domain-containing protein [Morganella morganii]EGT3636188.1 DUF1869 domain-containing protein [Morganella morganii]